MRTAKRKKEWFDDDSFWRETYPFMFPASRFEGTDEEIEKVMALTSPEGNEALDLCCGPGRCSIALAKRGFNVTGVDRTEYLLTKARSKARSAGVKIRWVRQDMRDFVRADTFDLTISMFTSFGYFDNRQEDLDVLRNMLKSLRPGGKCLIDVGGKEHLAKIFLPITAMKLPNGTTLVQRHEIFDDWTRIRNEWIVIKGDRAKRFNFHHTLYSGLELKERMESVGFKDINLYGNLDGDAYGPDTSRLIAVASRPSTRQGSRAANLNP